MLVTLVFSDGSIKRFEGVREVDSTAESAPSDPIYRELEERRTTRENPFPTLSGLHDPTVKRYVVDSAHPEVGWMILCPVCNKKVSGEKQVAFVEKEGKCPVCDNLAGVKKLWRATLKPQSPTGALSDAVWAACRLLRATHFQAGEREKWAARLEEAWEKATAEDSQYSEGEEAFLKALASKLGCEPYYHMILEALGERLAAAPSSQKILDKYNVPSSVVVGPETTQLDRIEWLARSWKELTELNAVLTDTTEDVKEQLRKAETTAQSQKNVLDGVRRVLGEVATNASITHRARWVVDKLKEYETAEARWGARLDNLFDRLTELGVPLSAGNDGEESSLEARVEWLVGKWKEKTVDAKPESSTPPELPTVSKG